ncbi:MAG: phosphonoacetaldehyde reductase [Desulfobacterales bacterium]|jgi:alcohol dehydrogenase|nr:phosphonoacetaldehyde reductase [Desulfobacterales bacterium]
MEQKIIKGPGSINKLTEILREYLPGRILLVTGKKSYSESGAEEHLSKIIKGFEYCRFYDFKVNPRLGDIEKGVGKLKKENCDFILAIGGGSVIDTAKAISVLACNKGNAEDYVKGIKKLNDKKIPSVTIPTTAGTGSESTRFSVIYIGKTKYSLEGEAVLSDYAILDHVFTNGLSPVITASTGMDALCQGIESFWSVNSTDESRKLSKEAITLAISSIEKAVNDPDDNSRGKMLEAANLAGRAINVAKTTAAHSVSYPFTSYFKIPHGHAVALTLPHFIQFNNNVDAGSVKDARGVLFVKERMKELVEIIGCTTASGAKHKIIKIMKEIGLETSLINLGISKKELDIIVENGFNPQRVKNNPRKITKSQLRKILERII